MSWDLCLARRAAIVGAVATLVTLIVVASTDAGGPWPSRLGMTAALAPVAGALGALSALRVAIDKGELRALAALGADPSRATLGAAVGGAIIGLVGAAVAASPLADLSALFPPVASSAWVVEGDAVRELSRGLRVAPGGVLSFETPTVAASTPAGAAWATAALVAIALYAVACPLWIAAPPVSPARRALVGATALVGAIVSFQLLAAGRAPGAVLAFAPAVLLADVALRLGHRSAR